MTRYQRVVLGVAILASFISFLDGTVINVALPAITRELGGGLAGQQWVVDAYLISLTAVILLAGSLSDAFGRRRVIFWGLIGFGAASVLCAISPTDEFLIVSRGIQGIAGALLVPSSLAIIISNFDGPKRAKAIGQWTAWTSTAFLAGPLLGGVLVDLLSWRLVFAINVIPIAVTLVMLRRIHAEPPRPVKPVIDYRGAVLGVFGIGLPVFALIEQGRLGWSNPVVSGALIVGIAAFALFILNERRVPQPMLPLSLFAVRNFWVGNVATTFVYAAISLGSFLLTLFLQQVAGYTATQAGLASLPSTIISISLSSLFGTLAGTYGSRLFMAVGPVIAAVGWVLLSQVSASADYLTQVFPGTVVFALGMTVTVAPLTAAILGAIDPERAGIASAVNNAVSRVAGLIATAAAALIVGEALTVDGFSRGVLTTAALLVVGGVVSAIGIQNARRPAQATPPAS
ncbi:DHA2 family efflux MFS transporter permease subunit [Subtercola boreus]|uniref:MFS transporter n=1 Tax=Subtercola boreus TaxID=120213 RepID=A0A3E0WCJ1_9MICO|nr:DHA2 family efflux MFS transporter permease subunit [Subtercola boreus]RFA20260.1 MFS transporter [Subtercola boreus]RFA20412.1 MFS transporter [Subtercola boreus]RFA26664.1 MFS transporter [Subtercola boreus]